MIVLSFIGVGILVIGLILAIWGKTSARKADYSGNSDFANAVGNGGIWAAIGGALIALIFLFASTFYQNGVGEAKVVVNSIDKTIVGTIETPGSGFKSPFEDFVDFDLFSQPLTFAGGGEGAPSYTGGAVNGKEITVNVGGVDGGSTRANIDLVATYSLGTEFLKDIYSDFRSQERFTEQIVQKQLLSIARQVPAEYTAVEFRGTKRGEAELEIQQRLNEKLKQYGVEFTSVTIQDVRYPDNVESALNAIEEANQAAQKAEAEKRTAQVQAEKAVIEAKGKADAQIAAATGEAEANRLLAESVTPAVIELKRIEALTKAAESGQLIIDGGSGDLLLDARK